MGCNCCGGCDKKNCNKKLDRLIDKLQKARQDARCGNLKQVECRLAESIRYIKEVLHCSNKPVFPPTLLPACDPTGAIPLTSGLNGAPSGTSNLLPGNKYVSPFGLVMTWTGDTITVCEVPGNEANVWSISGPPLIITSGIGTQQRVPSLNGNPQAAAVGINEGSILVFSASEVNGPITNARYVSSPASQTSASYQGFNTSATEFYLSSNGRTILDSGYTLSEMLGV
ncbi:hypothetical protein H1D32_07505 [Anaerobacillus sp. CMMVII]|uniref:hypothetical protein n=1 Tax=Anaerobacillus sp. CMMVII TaxID=2755588 RepID=UPI0021B71803|nr:hypothetical protein [Anaerobacillus sp. CMMVII]MCT8137607.1 hypothetical protein [Anaerobacillus sp. CMMVII]